MSRLTERIDDVAYNGYRYILAPVAWGFMVFGAVLLAAMAYEKISLYLS